MRVVPETTISVIAATIIITFGSNIGFVSGQQSMSVTVNKDSFSAGEQVSITGKLENAAQSVPVAIEVRDPDNQTIVVRSVSTDAQGNYKLDFKIPSTVKEGQMKIFASAEVNGEKISSSKSVTVAGTSQISNPARSKCLIATAAFGSDLAPQVQLLREFRDNHILTTASGSSFMNAFNAWYYSFSPGVADYERGQPWMQQIVRTAVYPLLGILGLSQGAYTAVPGEYGALSAGFVASSLIGAVYLTPAALSIKRVRKGKFRYKIASAIVLAALLAILSSIIATNATALTISTSLFVLVIVAMSALFSAKVISYLSAKMKNRFAKGK